MVAAFCRVKLDLFTVWNLLNNSRLLPIVWR